MPITANMNETQIVAELAKINLKDSQALRSAAKEATPKQMYEVIVPHMLKSMQSDIADALRQVNGAVLWDITGDGGGKWAMVFPGDGTMKVTAGDRPDATATIQMAYEHWKQMQSGETQPQQLFMAGQMVVTGDLSIIMQLQTSLPQLT